MKSITANIVRKFKVVIILTIAAALSLGIYMYQGNKVTLEIDGEFTELVSYSNTVEELIETEEVKFEKGSYINVPLDTEIEKDLNIIIKNPKNYIIQDNGETLKAVSIYDTVEDILRDQKIELGKEDYTLPKENQKISQDSSIRIYRVKTKVDIKESDIDFKKEVKDNKNLDKGKTRLVQKGEKGVKETHIKKKHLNKVLVSQEIEKEEVTKKPVTEIIERGTKEVVKVEKSQSNKKIINTNKTNRKSLNTSRGKTSSPSRGNSRKSRNIINMTATAYDLSFQSTGKRPGDPYYGITSSGTKARHGSVAVDPRIIPLGTKLYIESLDGTPDYGYATAEDTGGAIKGNRIDLFFKTANEVRRFGRRQVKVHILK